MELEDAEPWGLMGNMNMYKVYRVGIPRASGHKAALTSPADVRAAVEIIDLSVLTFVLIKSPNRD